MPAKCQKMSGGTMLPVEYAAAIRTLPMTVAEIGKIVKCEKGHGMAPTQSIDPWCCNRCEAVYTTGAQGRRRCTECDYDLCERCCYMTLQPHCTVLHCQYLEPLPKEHHMATTVYSDKDFAEFMEDRRKWPPTADYHKHPGMGVMRAECGYAAANWVLRWAEGPVMEYEDLVAVQREFAEMERSVRGECVDQAVSNNGWFSSEAVETALKLRLGEEMVVLREGMEVPAEVRALVICTTPTERNGQHWAVALRESDCLPWALHDTEMRLCARATYAEVRELYPEAVVWMLKLDAKAKAEKANATVTGCISNKRGPMKKEELEEKLKEAKEKPEVEADEALGGGAKKRKAPEKKKRKSSFKMYIHRVMKKVVEGNKMTTKGMVIVNSFVTDLFERLAGCSQDLLRYAGTATLREEHVIAAVKLQLPSEMARQALKQGAKAVGAYTKAVAAQQKAAEKKSGKKTSGKKASK